MKPELTPAEELDLSSLCLALAEHSPLPMAAIDADTRLVRYGNSAFCRMLDLPPAHLVGRRLDDLLPAKDQSLAVLEEVVRTGKPAHHTEQSTATSHPVFWSYVMWPVESGAGLVGVMIQVTETGRHHDEAIALNEALLLGSLRQQEVAETAENLNEKLRAEIVERGLAEDALRESDERFRTLFGSAPIAIFVCGRDGAIEDYNRRAAELWGAEPAGGSDPHRASLRLWLPDGRPVAPEQSPLLEVLRTGLPALDEELFIERRDGSRLPVLASFAALKDAQGETTGAIISFIDITERRALEKTLVARAAELTRADRSKDEFLAMLAHELRNPLAPLRNAAQILSSPGAGAEAHAQARGIIPRQIENMTRMIDDLLDVSRITEGKIGLRTQPVGLADLLSAAASAAQPGIIARHQELTVSPPAQAVYLQADATRLEQVLGNLLHNASKYSPSGAHISLTAERAAGAGEEPPEVIIRVRDDGIGISPELLPYIFDLFVQGTRASDRTFGGLGIGLTLVQRLVKMHGGSVEALSAGPGLGSEFIVRLPIISGADPAPSPPSPPPAPETPRRILIVDDNADSTRTMATLQRLRGHEARCAFSGPEALVIAAEFIPEVVLLDIGLPGMDGYEVARRLRAMPRLAGVFIVAMTGYSSAKDRAHASAAGIDEYLVKPVDLEILREWLRHRE